MLYEEFDENQFCQFCLDNLESFTVKEKSMLHQALEHARNKRDFWHIREWLLNPETRLMPKVSLDTFLDDPLYL